MASVNAFQRPVSIEIRGRFGRLNELGQYLTGFNDLGDENPYVGVYQKRKGPRGQYFVRMLHVITNNPNSIPQQNRRTLFGDAVRSWQSLTEIQKIAYRASVRVRHKSPYNQYIKEYMNTH
jgi:hypothetical protein